MLNNSNPELPEGFSSMFAEAQKGTGFFARIN